MPAAIDADICVIGAGAGGLAVAAGAAQLGARTVLIEKGAMGGDCLNTGCVPSKALLAAAHAADDVRRAGRFGVRTAAPTIDAAAVYAHVRRTIAAIAPHDSTARFEGLGVTVIRALGRFVGPRQIRAGDTTIRARRVVVATGSSPMVPSVPGLETVSFMTNESVFDRERLPEHLIILGGGPIGIEMAQAHRHLDCRVTVVERDSILSRDDWELVDVVRRRLREDGVTLVEGARVGRIEKTPQGVSVILEQDGGSMVVEGSDLLVAAGRRPNVEGLDLEQAGVRYSSRGIQVDARLRTSNPKVFAIGDVTGGYQFTHAAGYHAGIVLRNALFRLPAKVDERAIPWVTYTDPELAHVGMTEESAPLSGRKFRVLRWSLHENDRAQAEADAHGLIKVVVAGNGRILGASIVGPGAGELILPWVLAIGQGMKIEAMARVIAPYPTLGEVSKRVAGSAFVAKLFSDRTRRIVRFLAKFG